MPMPTFKSPVFFALLLACQSVFVAAADIVVGEPLPQVAIADKGECVLKGDEIDYQPWQSEALRGQVYIVEYVAARAGVDKINAAFFSALEEASLPADQVGVIKMVNSDDAMWGTSGLVAGEIEKTKRKEPQTRFVIDAEGLAQQKWDLQKKGAALAILDAEGEVLFFKEGGVAADDISRSLELIRQQLPSTLSVAE